MEQAHFLLFLTATHNAGDLQQEKPLKEVAGRTNGYRPLQKIICSISRNSNLKKNEIQTKMYKDNYQSYLAKT